MYTYCNKQALCLRHSLDQACFRHKYNIRMRMTWLGNKKQLSHFDKWYKVPPSKISEYYYSYVPYYIAYILAIHGASYWLCNFIGCDLEPQNNKIIALDVWPETPCFPRIHLVFSRYNFYLMNSLSKYAEVMQNSKKYQAYATVKK